MYTGWPIKGLSDRLTPPMRLRHEPFTIPWRGEGGPSTRAGCLVHFWPLEKGAELLFVPLEVAALPAETTRCYLAPAPITQREKTRSQPAASTAVL